MTKNRWQDPHAEREAQKYASPVPSRELIIAQLKKQHRSLTYRQLLKHFAIESQEESEALRRRLRAMVRDRQIVEIKRRCYAVVDHQHLIEGKVRRHKSGHGSLISEDYPDAVHLSEQQMRQAFDGDTVLARITYNTRHRHQCEGIIIKIIKRAHEQIVGRYYEEQNKHFVAPLNKRVMQPIIIPKHEAHHAQHGQVVIAAITLQPSDKSPAMGRITKILGDHMAPGMETSIALYAHRIPHRWPHEVTQAIAHLTKEPSEQDKRGRCNLTHLPFVTIDGENAKDFDDAIYAEKRRFGGWRLYVAIADVSHYIKPNSTLDEEAFLRGNSVYFPGKVIPMLPTILSNHLCSLNPHVDRLCMVCEMGINQKGKITRYKFYPAVIRSQGRLTYTAVGALFANQATKLPESLIRPLQTLYALYKTRQAYRFSLGAITFNMNEIDIIFGKNRKIKRLVPIIRNDAHQLVEECMLCANLAAAKFIEKHHLPGLYRVHTGPKQERLEELRGFLAELGLQLKGDHHPTPQHYSDVLAQASGRPDYHLVEIMLLRSMTQALYTPNNTGHFSLNFDQYTHFTSPIRRYPDIVVHRIIKTKLSAEQMPTLQHDTLIAIGEHCSITERRADEATREVVSWLKCEHMLEKVGQIFHGVIVSVTHFGLFIELDNIFVEGLLHINELKHDHYQFNPTQQCLVGQRRGHCYKMGDALRIVVARVDLDKREIDFALADTDHA